MIYPLGILLHGVLCHLVEAPGINLIGTVDFILLLKCEPSTCFKMESPTIRFSFLGIFTDFEFFEGSLCGFVLLSFNFFFLLLFGIARKLLIVNLRV